MAAPPGPWVLRLVGHLGEALGRLPKGLLVTAHLDGPPGRICPAGFPLNLQYPDEGEGLGVMERSASYVW